MKRSIKKIVALMMVLTLSLGVMTACGKKSSSDSDEVVIRVADFTGGGCVWNNEFIIAYQNGFFDEVFKDDHVKIEVTQFANGPAVNEAFIAGEVDVVNGIGDQPVVIGMGNNIKTTVLAGAARQGANIGIIAKANSGISTAEDLKGKKIGVAVGTYVHKSLIGILSDAGIGENDVEITNITSTSDADAAFASGDIDAYLSMSAYHIYTNINSGDFVKVADLTNHPAYSYIVASDSFVNTYPSLIEKFVEALRKGEEWSNQNKEEAYKVIGKYADMDPEKVKIIIQEADCTIELDDAAIENFNVTYDFLKQHDMISADLSRDDIKNHINTSFLDKVLAK